MAASTTPTQTVAVNLTSVGMVDTVTITSVADGGTIDFAWGILGAGQVVTPTAPNTVFTPHTGNGALNGTYQAMWTGKVSGGASGTTLTLTAATSNFSVVNCKGWVQTWDGYDGVGYVGGTNSGTSTTNTTPTLSPASGKAIAIVCLMRAGSGVTWGAPSNSFTDPGISGSTISRNLWRFVASSSGTYNSAETMSGSNAWTSMGFVHYEAVAGGVALNPLGGGPLTGFVR